MGHERGEDQEFTDPAPAHDEPHPSSIDPEFDDEEDE